MRAKNFGKGLPPVPAHTLRKVCTSRLVQLWKRLPPFAALEKAVHVVSSFGKGCVVSSFGKGCVAALGKAV